MQLDRRRLVRASLGISALSLPIAAQAQSRSGPPASAAPRRAPAIRPDLHPNSGLDETENLQAAIDAAVRLQSPIELPPGRFVVRGLRLPSGTRITGAGPNTVIRHIGGPSLLAAENASDISISNVTLVGGYPHAEGRRGLIEFVRTRNIEIAGIVVTSATRNAVVLDRCSGRITGCRISSAGKAGIFSIDSDGGMEISHNELTNISNNAILVWRSAKGEDGTIVAFNRISRIAAADGGSGENGNAVNVFRAGNVIVSNNRISDCAYSAVRANSASNVQILSNSISRMSEVAIFVEFAFDGAVVSGNLVDGATTGITVTNFDHGGRLAAVSGNLVRNIVQRPGEPTTSGYGIAVEADVAVNGNTIENAQTAGLAIGWGRYCRDVAATGNVIRKCTIGISVTDDANAGAVLLTGNMITGSVDGAIRRTDHGRPTSADLTLAPPAKGRLAISGNATA